MPAHSTRGAAAFRKRARACDGKIERLDLDMLQQRAGDGRRLRIVDFANEREVTWSCSGHTQPMRAAGASACALRRSAALNSASACATVGSISTATNSLTDADAGRAGEQHPPDHVQRGLRRLKLDQLPIADEPEHARA